MHKFLTAHAGDQVRKFDLVPGDALTKLVKSEITIKQPDEGQDATFSATLSEIGVMDSDGDIIMPGAFDGAIETLDRLDMRFMHDRMEIVGYWTDLRLDGALFRADGSLYTGEGGYDTPRKCLRLGRSGQLRGVSIGFRIKRMEIVIDDDREPWGIGYDIYDLELVEASLVDRPANPSARIDPGTYESRDRKDEAEILETLAKGLRGILNAPRAQTRKES